MAKKNFISIEEVPKLNARIGKNKITGEKETLSDYFDSLINISKKSDIDIKSPQLFDLINSGKNKFTNPFFGVERRKQKLYDEKGGFIKDTWWTDAYRPNAKEPVSIAVRNPKTNEFLFVIQPRVAFNKMVIEFPAGLRDEKDPSGRNTALRELKEETGMRNPKIVSSSDPLSKSAGIITEVDTLVEATSPRKNVGSSKQEQAEDIKAFWATPKQFVTLIDKKIDQKEIVGSVGSYYYMKGFSLSQDLICGKLSKFKKYKNVYNKVCT